MCTWQIPEQFIGSWRRVGAHASDDSANLQVDECEVLFRFDISDFEFARGCFTPGGDATALAMPAVASGDDVLTGACWDQPWRLFLRDGLLHLDDGAGEPEVFRPVAEDGFHEGTERLSHCELAVIQGQPEWLDRHGSQVLREAVVRELGEEHARDLTALTDSESRTLAYLAAAAPNGGPAAGEFGLTTLLRLSRSRGQPLAAALADPAVAEQAIMRTIVARVGRAMQILQSRERVRRRVSGEAE